jgi:hypothetical protein
MKKNSAKKELFSDEWIDIHINNKAYHMKEKCGKNKLIYVWKFLTMLFVQVIVLWTGLPVVLQDNEYFFWITFYLLQNR